MDWTVWYMLIATAQLIAVMLSCLSNLKFTDNNLGLFCCIGP